MPLVMGVGVGSVPGIQYTAEDLAFLQRMKNVKQYKIFEVCITALNNIL